MSDSEKDPLRGLLSEFALGPAWARGGGEARERKPETGTGREDRPPRRDDREPAGDRDSRGGGGRRPFQGQGQGRGGSYEDRRPPQREEAPPEPGVRVTLIPDAQAIHLIGREIHQVARVYPLFDVAQILLAERGRCRAVFEVEEGHSPLFRGKLDESLFVTREEAARHIWQAEFRGDLIEEETIEVDPPAGNFQTIARCGVSGEWLGPPNFHSYQTNLRRLHRERFPHMPFEVYSSKVRTERGEEAVNGWLETMKTRTRWRLKAGNGEPWIEDRAEAERVIGSRCLENVYQEVKSAEIPASVPGKNLSPTLLASLRMSGSHARKHPAILIPAVCRSLEAEHLPVFKRQGKLHTGPARPHSLAPETVLAARPAAMVAWIRGNSPAKLAGLWKSVLPEGVTEPTPDFAADLFWLLHQGHILLYADDTLMVQEPREAQAPKKPKGPKNPDAPKPTAPAGDAPPAGEDGSAAAAASFEELVSADTAPAETPEEPAGEPEDAPDTPSASAEIGFDELPAADASGPSGTSVVETPESGPIAIEGLLAVDDTLPESAPEIPKEEPEERPANA